MNMLMKSTIALLLAGGLSTPALAATTAPTKEQGATMSDHDQSNAKTLGMRQQLTSDLTKAGFTDIRVMPESFLVRAKDSAGNPVMMVINPDSVTAVTEMSSTKNSNTASNSTNTSGQKVMSGKNANGDPTPPAKQ